MKKANAAAKERKETARRKEMEENFAKKKADWLKSHGFNELTIAYFEHCGTIKFNVNGVV